MQQEADLDNSKTAFEARDGLARMLNAVALVGLGCIGVKLQGKSANAA